LSSESFASIYMDAPFVQASYASTDNVATKVVTEDFDSLTPIQNDYATSQEADGSCPENIAVGTVSPTSQCLIYGMESVYGGATTSSSDPTNTGVHSTYAATHQGPLTISFPTAKKYVGFWWSAGSPGNSVTFMNASGDIVAELNADYIYNAVSAETINSLGGSVYLSADYLGHPGHSPQDIPENTPRYDIEEPFVYIHVFARTGINAIQLSAPGYGFELDNLTTSDLAPNVNQRLVQVRDIYAGQVLPTPSPNPGYEFEGWCSDSGFENCIGMPGVTYYPDSASSTLYPQWFGPYTYTFTYSAGSHGTLTGDSAQTVNLGLNGTAVTAVANSGYHFVNWSDSSTANPRTDINASGDISVSANFSPDAPTTYTFTYSAGSHGTLTGFSSQTVSAGASGTAITPVANSGYHFVNWSDSSTANPRTDINASGNISVSANFSPDAGGGGDRGGGGGGGGEYSPPSPPETIIIIPATPSQPVIVQQPKKSGVKPAREVKVSKVESTTLIQIAPKPLITLGSSDIAIQGLNKGQYIRVTVTGVNGASQVITPSDNSELNTIINNNPKSKLKIEITPTLSSALKTGARIGINGAKKNQRVRVTVQ